MKKIYEGRTKEDAIREACKDLNQKKEDLIIEVLEDEMPKKTMFNILDRKRVKIEVQIKKAKKLETTEISNKDKRTKKIEKTERKIDSKNIEENIALLEKVLKEFKKQFEQDDFNFKIEQERNDINVLIEVNKNNKWIGYRGKTLNALQTLLTATLASNFQQYARVYVNIGKYKEERKKQLESLAEKISKTVLKTKKRITLEPMSSYERKIIHDYISKEESLKSESIGEEPNRKIVVSPK